MFAEREERERAKYRNEGVDRRTGGRVDRWASGRGHRGTGVLKGNCICALQTWRVLLTERAKEREWNVFTHMSCQRQVNYFNMCVRLCMCVVYFWPSIFTRSTLQCTGTQKAEFT